MMNISWREVDVRYFAVAASLLLSLYSVLLYPIPNTDAFTYIRAAEIYLQHGVSAAFTFYPWSTYSVLIAWVHTLTGLDIFAAAHLLNAIFFAGLSYIFITLIREIDNSTRLSIIAAIFILLYPQLNEYRSNIIRDIAYLVFSLIAFMYLVRLFRYQRLRYVLGFCLMTCLAALFRIEALAFLFLAPLVLLLQSEISNQQRLKLIATTIGIAFALGVSAILFLFAVDINPLNSLRNALTVYQPFFQQANTMIDGGTTDLSSAIFLEHAATYSEQYILIFLSAGLMSILLIKLITGFGWVVLLTLAYGLKNKLCTLPAHIKHPSIAYLLIALSILFAFMFATRFMSSRYALLFCTVAVLLVPVIIDRAATLAQENNRIGVFKRVVGFLILYCIFDAYISFGENKNYQRDVAVWVKENTPATMPLITNNHYVAYHSDLIEDYDKTVRLVDPRWIEDAPAGARLVFTLERNVDVLMQNYVEAGVVELERYFPTESEPQLGVYRRLPRP